MNDIKATEKASEEKKTDKSPDTKKKSTEESPQQQATVSSATKRFLSLALLLIIVSVAAFPFVAPQKFNTLTYKIFYGNTSAPQQTIVKQKSLKPSSALPSQATKTKENPASAITAKTEDSTDIKGFTLVEADTEEDTESVKTNNETLQNSIQVPLSVALEDSVITEKTANYDAGNITKKSKKLSDTVPSSTYIEKFSESIELAQSEHKAFDAEIKKLQEKNNILENRIVSLEKMLAYSSFDTKRRALAVIAAMELQKTILQGKNFQKELDRLHTLSSKDIQEKLDSLKSLNGKVKSDYTIQQDFKSAMQKALILPTQSGSGSFWAKVENIFRSLIVIRKTTDTAQDFQSKLNKAEKLVNEYLFTDALAELKNAPTDAQIIFNAWKEEVENKEAAKQIIGEVLNDSLVNFGSFNSEQTSTGKE